MHTYVKNSCNTNFFLATFENVCNLGEELASMANIELRNLSKRWGTFIGVENFNLTIPDKEFLVLLGPSGCGKTTTMRMIAGLEEVSEGEILIDGKVTRGFLGVQPAPITLSIAKGLNLPSKNGAFISRIVNDGPADKAGLIPGDIVTKIDNSPIKDKEDLLSTIANIKPGSKIDIEIYRKGKKLLVPTKIGERPK